jgi:hypothetical protein
VLQCKVSNFARRSQCFKCMGERAVVDPPHGHGQVRKRSLLLQIRLIVLLRGSRSPLEVIISLILGRRRLSFWSWVFLMQGGGDGVEAPADHPLTGVLQDSGPMDSEEATSVLLVRGLPFHTNEGSVRRCGPCAEVLLDRGSYCGIFIQ